MTMIREFLNCHLMFKRQRNSSPKTPFDFPGLRGHISPALRESVFPDKERTMGKNQAWGNQQVYCRISILMSLSVNWLHFIIGQHSSLATLAKVMSGLWSVSDKNHHQRIK